MIKTEEKLDKSIFDFHYFGSGSGHRYNGCIINIMFTNAPTKPQINDIIKLAPKPIKPKKSNFLNNLMLAKASHSFSNDIHEIYSKTESTIEDPEALVAFELDIDNWFQAINQFCPITLVYRAENRRAYGKYSVWHQKSIDAIPQLVANWTKEQDVFKLPNIEKQWFIIILKGIFKFGNIDLESLPLSFSECFFPTPKTIGSLENQEHEDSYIGKFVADQEIKWEEDNQFEDNEIYIEKKVTGNVFKIKQIQVDYDSNNIVKCKKEVKKYDIFLSVDSAISSHKTLKLRSKKSSFQIILNNQEQKEYKFIEIVSPKYNTIIPINTLTQKSINIILKCTSGIAKPAIYLYPETTQEIVVEHVFKGSILNTYPPYDKYWKVIAHPNGVQLNTTDNRKYNYLFWDGTYTFPRNHYDYKTGFYVEKEKTVEFLQQKLSKVGLNETEINDFVVYWLPQLNKNDINFIHFWINDNIDNCSVLNINPKPETSIRLFMEYQRHSPFDKKLPEQKLPSFQRNGFTMVEWGGGMIPTDIIE
jgi:hypothetical protein